MTNVTSLHPDRLCFECDNALLGRSGVYCRFFEFDVHDETLARDCEFFEPPPTGPYTIVRA